MERKVALITGGARGMGRAIAAALAERNWDVAVTYRTSAADARSLEEETKDLDGSVRGLKVDVSDPAAAEQLVRKIEQDLGRIDALVHCAGPYHRVPLLQETAEGWNSMFDNNLHPIFYLSRAAAPGMQKRGWGRIVTFSMANADQMVGQPHVTAHYIAKVGVLILTRTLAKILAPKGITVNAISPGFIETGSAPLEELAKAVKNIPAGYIGSPEDAVGVVLYLLSDDARYVNGTNIHLSGAWGI